MNFSEAYTIVNNIFSKWGQKGIALAGYTEEAWIFKSHVINDDATSGVSMIVEKNGNMRLFNVGHPEDRDVAYNAKLIDHDTLKQMLSNK